MMMLAPAEITGMDAMAAIQSKSNKNAATRIREVYHAPA